MTIKNINSKKLSFAFIILLLCLVFKGFSQQIPTYKLSTKPTKQRVDDLLKKMTLEEKIGQMTQLCASSITLDGTKKLDLNIDKIREYITRQHIGSFLSGTGKAEKWVSFIAAIQKVAVTETRLGIPIIFGMDNVHGSNYTDEATIFPHNLSLSCSFNTNLAEEVAKITAIESADLGHAWNFAPVLDVGKNPYWPRFYETFGEDPHTCARFGAAFIRSFQNCKEIEPYKLAACAKHFIGYSDPKSGWDRTPSEIPDQVLNEFFVPPFKAAFAAGVKTLMVNSGELNGEPVHGSKKYLNNLLRKQLGFDGVIVTDIKDILKIVEMHGGAADEKEATRMAIEAGIDVSMACSSTDFCNIVKDLVTRKVISEKRIDESVRRILKLKFELGLFENPYPSAARLNLIGSKANYEVAEKAALESIVLLKNDKNILPLSRSYKKIVLAGFAANSKKHLNGAWTFEWLGVEEERQPKNMETIFSALRKEMPGTFVQWIDSADVYGSKGFYRYMSSVNDADAILLTVGESPYSEFKGNTNDLKLSENQINMVKVAQLTGKPVILILIEGRPRVISDVSAEAAGILFAGHPGQGGGAAIAKILTGKYNPSGKLSFSYPGFVGHNTPYYHKKSEKYTAEWPFGHGLRYNKLEYSNLTVSDTLIANASKMISCSVTVYNPGRMASHEPVLWYIKDEVGRITRPAKILKSFEKKWVQGMDSVRYVFDFNPAKLLAYPDEFGNPILENGKFQIIVENLSTSIILNIPPPKKTLRQRIMGGRKNLNGNVKNL